MLYFKEAESQCIHDNAETTKAHSARPDNGAEFDAEEGIEDSGSQGNADDIVKEGPEKIFFNVANNGLTKFYSCYGIQKVIFHENGIGTFNSHICTGSDGNTQIGLHKCRSIVNTVADHGYSMPFRL